MVTAIECRAMALQHHRWAGMCRSPESREQHFRLEKELLALADNEERFHAVRADWSLSDASNFARSILSGHELLLEQQPVGTRPGPTETRNSVEV